MTKELSPEAKKVIVQYIKQGARMMASLISEMDVEVHEKPQNKETSEYLMEKFNEKFKAE